jgi:ribulose-phosphate 3-epimerase
MREPAIIASVLGADYARLGDEVAELEAAGVDRIQWDIMDGRFVPNLSFGADVVGACRPHATVPFEAHLMVEEPDQWLEPFAAAGCDTVLVHHEACRHLHRTLSRIRELGVRSGVALNPTTPLECVRHVLDQVDVLLVMTMNPGFGGQAYLETMEVKITEARGLSSSPGCRPSSRWTEASRLQPHRARGRRERSSWWRVLPSSPIPRAGPRRWQRCAAPSSRTSRRSQSEEAGHGVPRCDLRRGRGAGRLAA